MIVVIEWRVIRCNVLNGSVFIMAQLLLQELVLIYQMVKMVLVDFNYTSGAYAGENSYKVCDQNNALLI